MKEGHWRSEKKNSWDAAVIIIFNIFRYKSLKLLKVCFSEFDFQQLYMIPIWRKAILEIKANDFIIFEEIQIEILKEIPITVEENRQLIIRIINILSFL